MLETPSMTPITDDPYVEPGLAIFDFHVSHERMKARMPVQPWTIERELERDEWNPRGQMVVRVHFDDTSLIRVARVMTRWSERWASRNGYRLDPKGGHLWTTRGSDVLSYRVRYLPA